MYITLDGLYLKFETEDYDFLRELKEEFSDYQNGYQYSAKFASGVWDGKISMLSRKRMPYGLLPDVLRFIKTQFPEMEYKLSEDVKKLFRPSESDLDKLKWDWFNWEPAAHQKLCVEAAIKHRKGIILSATGSGKSFMMALTLVNLFNLGRIKKQLIIVPSIGLITQLKTNFLEYGIEESNIGLVYADEKSWDKPIVISTWHSLSNYEEQIGKFDSIFVDETHTAQADILSSILEKTHNANYRIGFTGTLPDENLPLWKIRSFIGTKLVSVTVDYLKQIGWLADCVIHSVRINYHRETQKQFKGDYNEVKDKLFRIPFRLETIKNIVNSVETGATLILVNKIDEGNLLIEYMKKQFPDREVAFVRGKTKAKDREAWRLNCNDPSRKIILVATYPVFQAGVDIPALAHVILGSQVKSKIRVLQTIGRVLRKHHSKDIAHVYDLYDCVGGKSWFDNQAAVKLDYYEKENFTVIEEEVNETSSPMNIADFF